jgi:hypothetical protein
LRPLTGRLLFSALAAFLSAGGVAAASGSRPPDASSTPEGALPEGNAYVHQLVERHLKRERALDSYTYDVRELREDLDESGRVKKARSRRYEVFFVRGRPVRRLVGEDERPLSAERQRKVDREAREKAEAISGGTAVTEQPGMRLSAILDRYDFRSIGREPIDARPSIVLDFGALPGHRSIDGDNVLRNLAGRIWVDEAEGEVVRAEARNTSTIKFALGLGASVATLAFRLEFRKVDESVWLPARVEATVAGRALLFKGFRIRVTTSFSNYRQFRVDVNERVEPPSAPPP